MTGSVKGPSNTWIIYEDAFTRTVFFPPMYQILRCVTFIVRKGTYSGVTIWTPDSRSHRGQILHHVWKEGFFWSRAHCSGTSKINAAFTEWKMLHRQATWLPLVLGVKHVQAPLGGPSARLTSFNEATRPTARRARNNNAWHHYSQLKYLQSCVERVGNFRHVEGNMSHCDSKNNENVLGGINASAILLPKMLISNSY